MSATVGVGFGARVTFAGDLDADGHADIAVAALQGTSGSVHVFHGGPGGLVTTSETELQSRRRDDSFGASVSGGADINGDGFDDLLAGAPGALSGAGAAHVYWGGPRGVSEGREALILASDGARGDAFGFQTALLGDVNGDGFDDIAISGGRSVYVFHGGPGGVDLGSQVRLRGTDTVFRDVFGSSIAAVGDVNGDGFADMAVCAPGRGDTGTVYVYWGSSDGLRQASEETVVSRDPSVQLSRVAAGGDLNQDGFADLLVGSWRGDEGARVRVFHGSALGVDTASEEAFAPSSLPDQSQFGLGDAGRLSHAGDVNGDGWTDVIVGDPVDPDITQNTGAAYLLWGSQDGFVQDAFLRLVAFDARPRARFGASVAGGGDIDGDGHPDILVGAPSGDEDAPERGVVYVLFGTCGADEDRDDACPPEDCDDQRPDVHPDAPERCNERDDDCDGEVDEGCDTQTGPRPTDTIDGSTSKSRSPGCGCRAPAGDLPSWLTMALGLAVTLRRHARTRTA